MSEADALAIARRFASALDRCDFAEAAGCLSADCRYQTGRATLTGPVAIIASYRESAEWGSHNLDRVIYESEVSQDGDGFRVLYIDRITHRGRTHEYRCCQRLTFNKAGRITRIVHEELPGEREKLDAFFAESGVQRGN